MQNPKDNSSSFEIIPEKVWGRIFKIYVDDLPGVSGEGDGTRYWHPSFRIRPSPLLLSQVCRGWKDIVKNTPALWSNSTIRVQLGDDDHSHQITEVHANAMKDWVARIGAAPWSLRVIVGGWLRAGCRQTEVRVKLPNDEGNPFHYIISPLAAESLRGLQIYQRDAPQIMTGLGSITFANVESLALDVDVTVPDSYYDKMNTPIADLPSLPHLKKAVLSDVHLFPMPDHFPWNNLTHLYLGERMSFMNVLKVLSKGLNLQQACFDCDSGEEPLFVEGLGHGADVTLSHLTHLTFLRDSPFDRPLTGFHFPKLTHLSGLHAKYAPWDPTNLPLIPSVTHLYIKSMSLDPPLDAYAAVLEATPLLTHLTLSICVPYGDLFRFLTYNPENPLLPNLVGLSIHCDLGQDARYFDFCGFSETECERRPDQLLRTMLASRTSRQTGCARLRQVTIRVNPRITRSLNPMDSPYAVLVDCNRKNDVVEEMFKSVFSSFRGLDPSFGEVIRGDSDFYTDRDDHYGFSHWDDGIGEALERIGLLEAL